MSKSIFCETCRSYTQHMSSVSCIECGTSMAVATPSASDNSRYVALVREWTLSAQSSSNTDDERAVYERCASALHQLNAEN